MTELHRFCLAPDKRLLWEQNCKAAFQSMDALRATGSGGAELIAGNGYGKTHLIRSYVESCAAMVARPPIRPAGTSGATKPPIPVLVASVSVPCRSQSSLLDDIVEPILQSTSPLPKGVAGVEVAANLLRDAGVDLLVVDEVQHLHGSLSNTRRLREQLGSTIAILTSLLPVVFVGRRGLRELYTEVAWKQLGLERISFVPIHCDWLLRTDGQFSRAKDGTRRGSASEESKL